MMSDEKPTEDVTLAQVKQTALNTINRELTSLAHDAAFLDSAVRAYTFLTELPPQPSDA